jgi:hypothetical protein
MCSNKNFLYVTKLDVRSVFFFSVLLAWPCYAQTDEVESAPKYSYRFKLPWYNTAAIQQIAPSPANPENIAEIERWLLTSEVRPDFNLELSEGALNLTLRPVARGQVHYRVVKSNEETESTTSGQWAEAFLSATLSDKLQITYGLQNFQWGPADILSPSNRIFHDNAESKGLTFLSQGKHLLRLNYTWSKDASTIVMVELSKYHEDPDFRAEEEFTQKALLKHEIAWGGGADYAGFVLGTKGSEGAWIGLYGTQTLFAGLSFHADASVERSNHVWYPKKSTSPSPSDTTLEQTAKGEDRGYALVVGGFRYAFENGCDLKLEYLFNQSGYDRNDFELLSSALQPTTLQGAQLLPKTLQRAAKPGLDYRAMHYGLVSLRVPDLFSLKDLSLYSRYLLSGYDRSSSSYASLEYGATDSTTLMLAGLFNRGKTGDDLEGAVNWSALTGVRQDF